MLYILVFLALSLSVLILSRRIRYSKSVASAAHYQPLIFWLFTFLLALIAGLREEIILDYQTYKNLFDTLPHAISAPKDFITFYFFVFKIEPLSLLLSYVGSLLGGEKLIFFLFSIITLALFGYSAYKLTPYPLVALLFYFSNYFFFMPMGQIRSGLAYSLIGIAGYLILKNQRTKSFFIAIISIGFHFSAVIFFLAYLWRKYEKIAYNSLFIIILGAGLGYSGLAEQIVFLFYNIIGEPSAIRSYVYGARSEGAPLLNLGLYQSLAFLFISLFIYKRLKSPNDTLTFLIAMVTLGCALRLFFVDFHQLGARLASPFLFFDCYILGYIAAYFRPYFFSISVVVFLCAAIFVYNFNYLGLSEGYRHWVTIF